MSFKLFPLTNVLSILFFSFLYLFSYFFLFFLVSCVEHWWFLGLAGLLLMHVYLGDFIPWLIHHWAWRDGLVLWGVKILDLSCHDLQFHNEWIKDIEAYIVSIPFFTWIYGLYFNMIIEANNLLVTTAALDCHVHYICPQLVSVGHLCISNFTLCSFQIVGPRECNILQQEGQHKWEITWTGEI